jgi:hypothetical protein
LGVVELQVPEPAVVMVAAWPVSGHRATTIAAIQSALPDENPCITIIVGAKRALSTES